MKKIFYFIKRFGYNLLPKGYFNNKYQRLLEYKKHCDQKELENRLAYYLKFHEKFEVSEEAISVRNFKRTKGTEYYLDLKEFFHYFNKETRFDYYFGDSTHINPFPTLFKARPINVPNENSVLFKLDKNRHFIWVKDHLTFREKKDMLVWRGTAYNDLRHNFVRKFWNHPLCNVGLTNKKIKGVPWKKEFLSIPDQFNYKFICSLEGNDVASNLKFVMASNSLCFMPKPKYETWFMEGTLKAGVHYVEIKPDFSDLEENVKYYTHHIEEAEQIIQNAHLHVEKFKNKDFEDLLCLEVLSQYALLSGQQNFLRFQ